jgi:glyoxylase-like metal-dependent hydrolase (beta-lactamase superfamily II)
MTQDAGAATDSNPLLAKGPAQEIAPGVYVIADRRVNLVPNIGIVLGDDAVLVVDTAMGPRNGTFVREEARRLGGSRRMYLTITHFHPEHGFGAQCFTDDATIVYNRAQAEELAESGQEFIEMFKDFGPEVAELLEGVELVEPHETYEERTELDLGGRVAQLVDFGGAHTKGDQVVLLPDAGVLFAGDLVENRFFPIVFGDVADGPRWIDTLERLARLGATAVVPGHGEVGGPELITDQRDYLVHVRDLVAERSGEDVDSLAAALEPQIRERYASWDNPEWIDFAIRNFHRGGAVQRT